MQATPSFLRTWAPVFALALSAFIFNTSEFIPIALLTDIARDFSITEAKTGQMITIYAWVVMVLSLPLMIAASRLEFKKLLLGILALFVVSHGLSAIAPSFELLTASRMGVACAHSIFWSIATPLAVRIAPPGKKAMALSMVVTGSAVAMIAGLPLGRVMGIAAGWRATFLAIGVIALMITLVFVWIFPTVPAASGRVAQKLPAILKNSRLWAVYLITALTFGAHFTAYSYIEPFMAQVVKMPEAEITWTLTLFGVAGLMAGVIFSRAFDAAPKVFYTLATLGVALFLALLKPMAVSAPSTMALCLIWGVMFTFYGLAFQSVIIGLEPQATPIAMSIFSGIANLGIGAGAFLGGVICTFDSLAHIGYWGAVMALAAWLVTAFYLVPRLAIDQ